MEFKDIDQLEDYLKGVADDALDLVEAVKTLPPRNASDTPKDHFPEARSAEIEALQRKTQQHYPHLPEGLAFLEQVIQRLADNLSAIYGNQGRLHGDGARGEFSQANDAMQVQYARAVKMHGLLKELIEQVARALRLAASKGFASKDTDQGQPVAVSPADPAMPTAVLNPADRELDDLFSMGGHR